MNYVAINIFPEEEVCIFENYFVVFRSSFSNPNLFAIFLPIELLQEWKKLHDFDEKGVPTYVYEKILVVNNFIHRPDGAKILAQQIRKTFNFSENQKINWNYIAFAAGDIFPKTFFYKIPFFSKFKKKREFIKILEKIFYEIEKNNY